MKLTPFVLPALLLFGSASPPPIPEVVGIVASGSDYSTLCEEFDTAYATWKKQVLEASREERSALRKANPTLDFWPKFIDLSDHGGGQAKLWLAAHIRDTKIRASKRDDFLNPIYKSLAEEHSDSEWFGDVLTQIYRDKRIIGEETTLKLYATVIKTSKLDENRAGALFQASRILRKSKDEELQARGAAYLEQILANYGETSWGAKVKEAKVAENTKVGGIAPDFKAQTIDDFEFSLADYRGKVVLLDFYGFW